MDAEIKVFSAENPELSNAPSFKPGVGQNIALCALLTARNSAFCKSGCLVDSTSFSPVVFRHKVMDIMVSESDFNLVLFHPANWTLRKSRIKAYFK